MFFASYVNADVDSVPSVPRSSRVQDVLEELDPSIEPVLSKAVIKQGNRDVVKLGDKELDWSSDFRLYITTKLGNPHYTPEVGHHPRD